jgi:hypothetical protein
LFDACSSGFPRYCSSQSISDIPRCQQKVSIAQLRNRRGSNSMSQPVSDVLFERLIACGVDTISSLPGDGVDDLFEGQLCRNLVTRIWWVQPGWAPIRATLWSTSLGGRMT